MRKVVAKKSGRLIGINKVGKEIRERERERKREDWDWERKREKLEAVKE